MVGLRLNNAFFYRIQDQGPGVDVTPQRYGIRLRSYGIMEYWKEGILGSKSGILFI